MLKVKITKLLFCCVNIHFIKKYNENLTTVRHNMPIYTIVSFILAILN